MSGISNVRRRAKRSATKPPASYPNIIRFYSNGMGGVDIVDIKTAAYRFDWKSNPPGKYMFVEYSKNIPMRYSQYIRKKFPMKLRGIFRNNVPGILNTGIFPDYSMNILRMLHAFF